MPHPLPRSLAPHPLATPHKKSDDAIGWINAFQSIWSTVPNVLVNTEFTAPLTVVQLHSCMCWRPILIHVKDDLGISLLQCAGSTNLVSQCLVGSYESIYRFLARYSGWPIASSSRPPYLVLISCGIRNAVVPSVVFACDFVFSRCEVRKPSLYPFPGFSSIHVPFPIQPSLVPWLSCCLCDPA